MVRHSTRERGYYPGNGIPREPLRQNRHTFLVEKPVRKFTNFMSLFGNSATVFLTIQGQEGRPVLQSRYAEMAFGYYSFRDTISAEESSDGFVKRTSAILIYGSLNHSFALAFSLQELIYRGSETQEAAQYLHLIV
jgi:hypothetical protein